LKFLKKAPKHLPYLWFIVGVVFITFGGSCLLQMNRLPPILKASPGQRIKLSAYFPLSFYTIHQHLQARIPNKSIQSLPLISNNLIVDSPENEEFDIQVRLLGAIPVKKLHVEIAKPVMVVPGGQAIGVLFSSKGVVIIGHLPLKGIDGRTYYPAKDAGLQIGDILLAMNDMPVNRVDEVEYQLRNYQPVRKLIKLTILRQGKRVNTNIEPTYCAQDGSVPRYMLGIYIEDPAAGVGTLTCYDPTTQRFAGLGHRIAEFAGKKSIPFNRGEIVLAKINGVRVGVPGQPGEKIGVFNSLINPLGKIEKNSRFGIYGHLYGHLFESVYQNPDTPIPAAYRSEVTVGPAQIYTVIRGTKVEHFNVEIIKVYRQDAPRDKGMVLKVVDPLLLKLTGGIIQGMSGSPIIQHGKFVGAVTHVLVNDPTKGYGVLAEWMIQEMNGIAS
jgi:stage IV sporulation protein B